MKTLLLKIRRVFFVPVFFIFLEDLRISGRNQAHLNCFNLFEPKTKNRFGLQAQY